MMFGWEQVRRQSDHERESKSRPTADEKIENFAIGMDDPIVLCIIEVKTDANCQTSLTVPSILVYCTIIVNVLWLQDTCGTFTDNTWCFSIATY